MSINPNPNTIIKINTTKAINAVLPQYLRTFAICSVGDTNMDIGALRMVSQSDYMQYMNPKITNNYTKRWLESFFSNSIGKFALLIELGSETTTITYPMLERLDLTQSLELETTQQLAMTLSGDYTYSIGYKNGDFDSKNIFSIDFNSNHFTIKPIKKGIGYLQVIASGSDISTTTFILKVTIKEPLPFDISNSIFEFNASSDSDVSGVTERKYVFNIPQGKFNAVLVKDDNSEVSSGDPILTKSSNLLTIKSGANIGDYLLKITTPATNDYMQYEIIYKVVVKASERPLSETPQEPNISRIATIQEDFSNVNISELRYESISFVDILKQIISESTDLRAYKYSVPRAVLSHDDFPALVDMYSQINSSCYFSGEVIKNADPNFDSAFVKLKTKKGFFGVYNNCINNAILDGAITGIMASNSYDISANNLMSPLNYKIVNCSFEEVKKAFTDKLTDAPVSWCGYQAGQKVLMGGRYADNTFFDYWYSYDNVKESIIANTTAFMIKSVNNKNSAIAYNQAGIKNIAMSIENTLNTCVDLGYINQFGEYLDSETKEIKNVGKLKMIAFEDYIKLEPIKYEKGIYGGFSCFIRIGRFITQIEFDISLG